MWVPCVVLMGTCSSPSNSYEKVQEKLQIHCKIGGIGCVGMQGELGLFSQR